MSRGSEARKQIMQPDPTFWIQEVPVHGDVMLAPMAGFSDVPHRALCRTYGASASYTEFVAAEEIIGLSPRLRPLLDFTQEDRPMIIQIFGNDAQMILNAAQIVEELEPDIIDINMGCSTRRVSGRGAGVGMMRNPELIAETFQLLSRYLSVPVTGKIRLGWEKNQNYLEVARILEDSGASMIAIHPRTKEQKYRGCARWDAIGEVKQAVNVPVIGNGDIRKPEDIDRMVATTGCDAVMIGRGAIGNPWLFARQDKNKLLFSEVAKTIRRHLELMCDYYGEYGQVLFRKYTKRYFADIPALVQLRKRLVLADGAYEFLSVLSDGEQIYGLTSLESIRASK